MTLPPIDFNHSFSLSDPVYVISMDSETLLFANSAACKANEKTLDEFIGKNIFALCYPDELEQRKRLLRKDKKLTNYEFKAMHWYKNETLWRRKEVNLVVDLELVEFAGVECRWGVELAIEETRRFVD